MTEGGKGCLDVCLLLPPSCWWRKLRTSHLPTSGSAGNCPGQFIHPDAHQAAKQKLALAVCIEHRCWDG